MPEKADNLRSLEIGGGRVDRDPAYWRLSVPGDRRRYANAQLDDHRHLRRNDLPWRPPVRIRLEARSSIAQPKGTLGFGFWNDPFSFNLGQAGAARRLPAPPQAVWFFYGSPPNDLALSPGTSGHGWRAMVLAARQVPSLLLAPAAAAAIALAQLPLFRQAIMRLAFAQLAAAEAQIDAALDAWHTYELHWEAHQATFWVDGAVVLEASSPPAGPLGFVAWIDNQYAVASPEKGFRFGVLNTVDDQALEIRGPRFETAG